MKISEDVVYSSVLTDKVEISTTDMSGVLFLSVQEGTVNFSAKIDKEKLINLVDALRTQK
jgi:hypothetical protein